MISFFIFSMNWPAASGFKRTETLRANIRLSLKDQGSRQDVADGLARPESSLDRYRQHISVYQYCQVGTRPVLYGLLQWLTKGARMDVCLVIQQRLKELGLEQRDP